MIKQIQLRGISRTPSDRLSEDGGLSESLNMYLDTAENAPALVPEDVTTELGLPDGLQAERIFIHKTANYENYIVVQDGKVVAYTPDIEDEEPLSVLDLADGETVNDITSVGNTLIISTSANMYFILYNERVYSFLGNKVPFPIINFEIDYSTTDDIIKEEQRDWSGFYVWNVVEGEEPDANDRRVQIDGILETLDNIWIMTTVPSPEYWATEENDKHKDEYIRDLIGVLKSNVEQSDLDGYKANEISSPIVIRYAVDIYGDKLSSVPILLNPLSNKPNRTEFSTYQELYFNDHSADMWGVRRSGYNKYVMNNLRRRGKIKATLVNQENLVQWKDLLTSIEIYISKPFYSSNLNLSTISDIHEISTIEEGSFNVLGELYRKKRTFQSSCVIDFQEKNDFVSELLLRTSECHLIKKITPFDELTLEPSEDLKSILKGEILNISKFLDTTSSDFIQLESQEMLAEDDMSHYQLASNFLDVFNNRLVLIQASQFLDYDYNRLNAYDIFHHESTGRVATVTYEVTYLLRGYSEDKVVKKKFTYYYSVLSTESIYAFQIFPDSRAFKMLVKATITTSGVNGSTVIKYGEFNMLPHPYLNCSYYYGGIEKELVELCTLESSVEYAINTIDNLENKLLISEMNKPFVFPKEYRYTFQAKVVGVAIATTALSQGQFGQFPLYVFTEDGIWAMETAADGSFITQKPLSREVCINPDSICSIDNAVVFVTDKAVMMIQGSQVMNISPYMNGKHYKPNASATELIAKQDGYAELVEPISDSDPFMKFMRDAKVAYDYTGQRLIFISRKEDGTPYESQYVYKIDSQTWHKVSFGLSLDSPLNSYPECMVQSMEDGIPNSIIQETIKILSVNNWDAVVDSITNETYYRRSYSGSKPSEKLIDFGFDISYQYYDAPAKLFQFQITSIKEDYISVANAKKILNLLGISQDLLNLIQSGAVSVFAAVIKDNDIDSAFEVLDLYYDYTYNIQADVKEEKFKLVSYDGPTSHSAIYNLSTVLDASRNQDTAKGILITRPFDLGMPDVYKSITSIKIRGDYDKGNIKYILQGSDDGRNFYTLNSLRGKSWKMFRIFILADLEPTERISWIDVDFEPRYNNKLR